MGTPRLQLPRQERAGAEAHEGETDPRAGVTPGGGVFARKNILARAESILRDGFPTRMGLPAGGGSAARGESGERRRFTAAARSALLTSSESEQAPAAGPIEGPLQVGVDLGTAYVVMTVLDRDGIPVAGEYTFAQVARDGLVVDFFGAVDIVRGMKTRLERRIGRDLDRAATGYPPGVPQAEVRATGNVLEAAGLACSGLIDEPSAANLVLGLEQGAIVDVGGGTTGVAVIEGGEVVHTADEATGGTHFSLVIAGALDVPFEEAERLKLDPGEQERLFPIIRPVMEKVGSIVARSAEGYRIDALTLVGGSTAFPGFADVIADYTGIETHVAEEPMFITPLGIAMYDGR